MCNIACSISLPRLLLLAAISVPGDDAFVVAQDASADRAESSAADSHLVEMPVTYDKVMVVIVSDHGAAAVRFTDVRERSNETGNGIELVDYEWRYLQRSPDATEETGTGTVFAKLAKGETQHGQFVLTAGPTEVTWRRKDRTFGFIQFDPRQVSVHPVSFNSFRDEERPFVRKKAELGPFLFPNEANAAQHREEKYDGPDTKPRRYNGDVAGPVPYAESVTVISDPAGIATFRFGEFAEEQVSESITHFGIPYQFSFRSHDGEHTESGEGVVYERYRDGSYDGGRLHIEAGPVHLQWSKGGEESGWLYYDPTWNLVWTIDEDHVETLIGVLSSEASAVRSR